MMPARTQLTFNGSADLQTRLVLAHGAGAPMDHPFMDHFANALSSRGVRVARFEFPYMAQRRSTGKSKPPDREPTLRATWLDVIEQLGAGGLVIGGKSMGGRIASLVADEAQVAGLICLGYPFHPAGNPKTLRVEHLRNLRTPALIVQGERDPFGNREEVAGYRLSRNINVHWLVDGDHSFKPRKSSGRSEHDNLNEAVEVIAEFIGQVVKRERSS
jgi:predicted alpha/beta-hydrolase family hydrolase